MKPVRPAADREEWAKEHRRCPYIFRPNQRSSLSRTYLCCYTLATRRCMFQQCPALASRPWEKTS